VTVVVVMVVAVVAVVVVVAVAMAGPPTLTTPTFSAQVKPRCVVPVTTCDPIRLSPSEVRSSEAAEKGGLV